MNDRPTPETDAEHAQFAMGGFTLDFCRKLERERDKAQEDATNYYAKIGELERERDEAREAAAKWESSFDAVERAGAEQARRADENREWALKAERERDEAIEARKASAADCLNQIENANARVSAAKRERDEYQDRLRIALGERDSWRMRSEQKYAMRSELEELLGVTPADASDEQFEKGLAALKSIIRERDEAREQLSAAKHFLEKYIVERDEAREALQRIADCDFVITLPDRMDAVRKIANDALNN